MFLSDYAISRKLLHISLNTLIWDVSRLIRMRNVLIHIYFGIDQDVIWEIVKQDLPVLKVSIDAILTGQELESAFLHHVTIPAPLYHPSFTISLR